MAKVVSIRRCHVCNQCSESENTIYKCIHCGKHFAPFFYFDDKKKPVQGDYTLRPLSLDGEWRPIEGLTVYWENY